MIKFIKRIFKRKKSIIPTADMLSDKDNIMDCDSDVHAINAFFTCFVDFEHSSYFNLDKVGSNPEMAALYFGIADEGEVTFPGVQTKNLLRLVEFITINKLWPSANAEPVLEAVDGYADDSDGDTFKKVIEALDAAESKHEDIGKAFRTYKLIWFYIAYIQVREVGIENIMGKQPFVTGSMAMQRVHKITRKTSKKFFTVKRIVGITMTCLIGCLVLSFFEGLSNLKF